MLRMDGQLTPSEAREAELSSWNDNNPMPAASDTDDMDDMDDIEEIVRSAPIRRSRDIDFSRPRLMLPPIRRRRGPVRSPNYDYRAGVTKGHHGYEITRQELRRSVDASDISPSSAGTAITPATSSCTDPWSASCVSGFVDEESEGSRQGNDGGDEDADWENDRDMFLVPKLEPEENEVNMTDLAENPTPKASSTPITGKRPRGRPRKHPKPSPEDKAKMTKGRSKTGCFTCRRRKKKCDERREGGCMNCEKNGVTCEGFPPKTVWRSGKEKVTACTTIISTCPEKVAESMLSPSSQCKINLRNIKLPPPIMAGVVTPADTLFLDYYIQRLSTIVTMECGDNNAFNRLLLPVAAQHPGLMHSILALASSHIDYRSQYGIKFLQDHPNVEGVESLQLRSQFHCDEAMRELHQTLADQSNSVIPATLGQMMCLVLQTLGDSSPNGQHRVHLNSYRKIVTAHPPEKSSSDSELLRFIDEFFQYHSYADDLIALPETSHCQGWVSQEQELPATIVQPAVRLLGVSDDLLFIMSKITSLRNTIRENMRKRVDPPVNANSLYRAQAIDSGLQKWEPAWPAGDSRDLAGLLYRQMLWVYLWRTIFPPKTNNWKIDPRLTEAVNDGIILLAQFEPRDSAQTLILAPAFVLGCAAFEPEQRIAIRKAIAVVKSYREYKNADTALLVLEEVWRLMDAKDQRSWDWQMIAHDMRLDFLAT